MAITCPKKRSSVARAVPLQESTLLEGGTVDADAAVIRHVKVLGRESKNGRTYSDRALADAARMYEGIEVNIDHPDKSKPGADRRLADRFGQLKRVTIESDGAYADLHYLKAHPLASQVVEAAQRMPDKMGLSHNADGKLVKRNGKSVVESIERVRSVDLVANPASTSGLYESRDTVEQTTIRAVFEALPADCKAKPGLVKLLEMDPSMGAVAEAPMDMPPADADADGQIDAAFKAAVNAVLDDKSMDVAGKIARIKDILKAQDKAMSVINGKEKQEAPAEVGGDEPTKESLQREVEALKAREAGRALLESLDREPSDVRVQALAAVPAESRKALVESWPKRGDTSDKPARFSAQRPAVSRPLYESNGTGADKAAASVDEFVKSVKRR